jgi:hypothetical protein
MDANDVIQASDPNLVGKRLRELAEAATKPKGKRLHRGFAALSPAIWYERDYRAFQRASLAAQLLWFYLYTCTANNVIGVFRITIDTIVGDIRHTDAAGVRSAIVELCEAGLIVWDEEEQHVFAVHQFQLNPAMGDERPGKIGRNNLLKGAQSVFYGLPDSTAKQAFKERYGLVLGIIEHAERDPEDMNSEPEGTFLLVKSS